MADPAKTSPMHSLQILQQELNQQSDQCNLKPPCEVLSQNMNID